MNLDQHILNTTLVTTTTIMTNHTGGSGGSDISSYIVDNLPLIIGVSLGLIVCVFSCLYCCYWYQSKSMKMRQGYQLLLDNQEPEYSQNIQVKSPEQQPQHQHREPPQQQEQKAEYTSIPPQPTFEDVPYPELRRGIVIDIPTMGNSNTQVSPTQQVSHENVWEDSRPDNYPDYPDFSDAIMDNVMNYRQ